MKQFILSGEPDSNGRIRLGGGDYHYLVKVRRLAPGEYFPACLPNGDEVNVRVCSVDNKTLVGEVAAPALRPFDKLRGDQTQGPKQPPIILFQSLPKGEKMDLIVRQAAEGGITEIAPFASEFSAVKIDKISKQKFIRWERIIKEARQQSGSAVATSIRQPLFIDDLFAYWEQINRQQPAALGLLFHHLPLTADNTPGCGVAQTSLHEYLKRRIDVVVLTIGPEGGFSPAEAQRFIAAGFKPFTIGGAILRTETAALYAQAAVQILLGERDSWETKQR